MLKSSPESAAPAVAPVFDIKNCGPLNRFSANGYLVHNSGGDKMNWQNLTRGSTLRKAVRAPKGYVVVVADSRNIEARLLDWFAGQMDLMPVYRAADAKTGPDIYCYTASRIYQREITPEDKTERQMVEKR